MERTVLHPWHGADFGDKAPGTVKAMIEIPQGSRTKYEIDKKTGLLKLDRVIYSSFHYPVNYGFIPRTLGLDGDPLDILVLTEHIITTGDIIMEAKPIGGFRMFDKNEIDDKIIAVMAKDEIYSRYNDITEVPESIIKRLKHYFLTYKNLPGATEPVCEITHIYGKDEAHEVIKRSLYDYQREILEKSITFKS